MKTLGIKPEEVAGTFGKSLVADTPEAQRRLRKALEAIGQGKRSQRSRARTPPKGQWQSGLGPVVVEARPDGKHTRTMMVDITERVLMEQEQARLQAQNEYLLEEIRSAQNLGDIIGESPGLRKVMQQIQLVAPTDAAVLVTGESGTGKELVARAIHENSPRKGRALIKVNCGAVPENLFESEFFGHMRGAFTGAVRDKPGRFELADGGTLFLDEIGEIPLAMQAKLLRVLQEQEIERVGDTRTRKINVRIIAATNRDLEEGGRGGTLPAGFVLSPQRFPHRDSAACASAAKTSPHSLRTSSADRPKRMNRPAPRFTKAQAEPTHRARLARQRARTPKRRRARGDSRAKRTAAIRIPTEPITSQRRSRQDLLLWTSASILTREDWKRQERESITAALKQSGGKVFGPGGAAELLNMKPTTLASRIKALGLNRRSAGRDRLDGQRQIHRPPTVNSGTKRRIQII